MARTHPRYMKLNQKSSMREERMSHPWMNCTENVNHTAPPNSRRPHYTGHADRVATRRRSLWSHPRPGVSLLSEHNRK